MKDRKAARVAEERAGAIMSDSSLRPDQAWPTQSGGFYRDYFGENGSRISITTNKRGKVTRVYAEYDDPHATSNDTIGQHFLEAETGRRGILHSGRRFRGRDVFPEATPESPTQAVGRVFDNAVAAVRKVR